MFYDNIVLKYMSVLEA